MKILSNLQKKLIKPTKVENISLYENKKNIEIIA